jgi:membrane-associated phospholipid phosphatase
VTVATLSRVRTRSVLGPLGSRIAAADRAVMTRVSVTESTALDQLMPRLSVAANNSVLWIGIAAGLAAMQHQRTRRAAWRGLASVAMASTASNVIGKGLTRRGRPATDIPPVRRLARAPRTTSFPSGHAASAAAFATGAALELPVLAVPLGVLAAAVGASRVVTGMHFPSDVAAGFAVGMAAGTLTLRWWPLPGRSPLAAPASRRRPPLAAGRPR